MFKAEVLKSLIEKTGMSERAAAEAMGVPYPTLRSYISGKNVPSLSTLELMAEYFAVPIDLFVGRFTTEEIKDFVKNYSRYFMHLRTDAYEKYLVGRKSDIRSNQVKAAMFDGVESPWPYNLYDELAGEPIDFIITQDMFRGLELALETFLTERQTNYLLSYYMEGNSMRDVGKKYDITCERVRQVLAKAIRTLRNPAAIKLIFNGYRMHLDFNAKLGELNDRIAYIEKLKKEGVDSVMIDGVTPISLLHLSVRAYNCLYRCDIKSIERLVAFIKTEGAEDKYGPYWFDKIRNLGKRSACEIIRALDEHYGTTKFSEKYLLEETK